MDVCIQCVAEGDLLDPHLFIHSTLTTWVECMIFINNKFMFDDQTGEERSKTKKLAAEWQGSLRR